MKVQIFCFLLYTEVPLKNRRWTMGTMGQLPSEVKVLTVYSEKGWGAQHPEESTVESAADILAPQAVDTLSPYAHHFLCAECMFQIPCLVFVFFS